MFFRSLLVLTLTVSAVQAASRDDIDFVASISLPPEVWEVLEKHNEYSVETRINPFYLRGDFDADGKSETAVLVKHRPTGKKGMALVSITGKLRVIGAGEKGGEELDNFDWMDAWYVFPKGKVEQGASEEAPPKLKGDAIAAIKTEAASGLIWWDGKRFRWYQQGD